MVERPDLDAMEREMADVRKRVAELERLMRPLPPMPNQAGVVYPITTVNGDIASIDDLPSVADFYTVDDGA